MPIVDDALIGQIFREESGRSVATLIRIFGDIDLAEDAVQEAFAIALRKWPAEGLPPKPGGWITTTARNRAIDHLRREARGRVLLAHAHAPASMQPGRTCCGGSDATAMRVRPTRLQRTSRPAGPSDPF